jgi:hypothetical protein
MKSIDAEIFELEQRLHRREASIKGDARELKGRSVRALMSPVSIVAAVALGFLVAGGVGLRKARARAPAVSRETKAQSKGLAVGGLAMAAVSWFIKNQFGGPVGLARFVISKIRKDEHPKTRVQLPALRSGV